jgi:pimeloyl-ACP methyl ester carboxylesterase
VALDYPDRVASLTLISTSPVGYQGPKLPPMSDSLREYFARASSETTDWSDRAAVIDYYVESARPFASQSRPFDEAPWRELGARDFERGSDLAASMTNHFVLENGESPDRRLAEIDLPTLVLHGTEDPLFPFGHGVALANEIRGAELVALEGTGHELPRAAWDVAVPAILRHTA